MVITNQTRKQCADLAHKYDLLLIVLYGSLAKGKTHTESDTDIAVKARCRVSLEKRLFLAREFDRIFPNTEVVDIRDASPLYLAAIAQAGVPLFERQRADFAEFVIYARNQFIDFLPYLNKLKERNREKLYGSPEKIPS